VQSSVERFDVGVLVRFARLDQPRLHAVLVRPRQHRPTAELLAVVGANDLRLAATLRETLDHARHADPGDRPLDLNRDCLVGRVVGDHQAFDDAPYGSAIEHEIQWPHLVGGNGTHQRLTRACQHPTALAATHLKPRIPVRPFDAFAAH